MKHKRLFITLACVLVLLVAMICLLPWPTRINLETTGIEVSEDGIFLGNCDIRMKGWKLDYLFRKDTVAVDRLEINTYTNQTLDLPSPYHAPLITIVYDEFDYTIYDVYFADLNQYRSVIICLDKDTDWFVIESRERYFIAANDDSAELQTYWDLCKDKITK